MNKIIICDLDGTIADCSHRQHYVCEGKKDWRMFFREMDKDAVNDNLNEMLKVLHQYYDVYFVTARPDTYKQKTIDWLNNEAGWVPEEYTMLMRNGGDYRKDSIVKKELLDQILAEGRDILCVFDDRKQVVEMWRENGLFTCQVADHDF